jgi:hypothetical protein
MRGMPSLWSRCLALSISLRGGQERLGEAQGGADQKESRKRPNVRVSKCLSHQRSQPATVSRSCLSEVPYGCFGKRGAKGTQRRSATLRELDQSFASRSVASLRSADVYKLAASVRSRNEERTLTIVIDTAAGYSCIHPSAIPAKAPKESL